MRMRETFPCREQHGSKVHSKMKEEAFNSRSLPSPCASVLCGGVSLFILFLLFCKVIGKRKDRDICSAGSMVVENTRQVFMNREVFRKEGGAKTICVHLGR